MGLATAVKVERDRESLYKAPKGEPELVRVPAISYLMVDGSGDPNTSAGYAEAIAALYAMSYGLKFALKKEERVEYRVGPLEGLWWSGDMSDFRLGRKADWSWTAMIAQPGEVAAERFAAMRDEVKQKKRLPGLERMRLERFDEGLCAQILHIGPYSAEGPTIAKLHDFIHRLGYTFDGRRQKHHEIYLGDPRRSAPERLKTVIRQPVVAH